MTARIVYLQLNDIIVGFIYDSGIKIVNLWKCGQEIHQSALLLLFKEVERIYYHLFRRPAFPNSTPTLYIYIYIGN